MKANSPTDPLLRDNSNRVRWLLIITIGCLLVVLIAILLPRADTTTPDRTAVTNESLNANTESERAARTSSPRRPMSSARASLSAPTAEEIVASKLSQFARQRRELAHALARHFKVEVPDDVDRFFDAVAAGHWEKADAIFKSLRHGDNDNSTPRSPDLGKIWRPIQETWGIARETQNWPAQKLLDYGEAVLGSLRPGMVYLGGTDPGCFIPTLLNETSEGERHIVFTQNALANNDYLEHLNFLYGDRLATVTAADSQRAFEAYTADAQKRLEHDEQFPNESKQIRPGENVRMIDGKIQVSGQTAVMAINERLFQMLLEKNPDTSFAMEVSFPFLSTYADAAPLGPILELRVQDENNALTRERAGQSVEYWRATAEKLLSDPEAAESLFPRFAYAKVAAEQADLLLKRGYAAEAEQTLRFANEIGPGSPEAVFRLLNLLNEQGRFAEALAVAENTVRTLPPKDRLRPIFGDNPGLNGPLLNAIEALKRLQKGK